MARAALAAGLLLAGWPAGAAQAAPFDFEAIDWGGAPAAAPSG